MPLNNENRRGLPPTLLPPSHSDIVSIADQPDIAASFGIGTDPLQFYGAAYVSAGPDGPTVIWPKETIGLAEHRLYRLPSQPM